MLDEKRLAEIRERAERATAGEWKVQSHNEDYGQGYGETTYFVEQGGELLKIGIADSPADYAKYSANADFIAHAREDVPALLDEIARLTAENARLARELGAAKQDLHLFAQCVTCEHSYDGGMRCRIPVKDREHKGDYCVVWQWRGAPSPGEGERGGGEGGQDE